ncbi:MAG: glycosyltransferase [Selenomonadaceae bacterium]|nr:glycosyltransferase [Selenomonadaceae bacterium]
MNNLPLVSILIPTYNQPKFFRFTLESAINQNYPNIEIIVSDDSTDDRVKTVFNEYKNCGRNLKYLKHGGYIDESVGERSLKNMENLLEHANGEFVNILYHDDLIYPQKISTMMKFFMSDMGDKIAIVSSQRDAIDENGNLIGIIQTLAHPNFDSNGVSKLRGMEVGRILISYFANFIGELSTVLIRRKDFYRDCVKKLSPGYFLGIRDLTMWDVSTYLEVLKDDRYLFFLEKPLSAFRMAGGSQNTYNIEMRIHMAMDWIAFVAGCYMQNLYIDKFSSFVFSSQNWYKIIVDHIFETDVGDLKINENVPLMEIESLLRASEAVMENQFDVVFDIAVNWIEKFSSETFEVEKYAVQNSHGIWIRERDLI